MKIKRPAYLLLAIISLVLTFLPLASKLEASYSNATSYTVIVNNEGQMQIVQDAYLPTAVFSDLALRRPGDLFILDEKLYIADTGNRRALRIDLGSGEREIFGEGIFRSPSGISADEDGNVYVADQSTLEAYRFNKDLELEQTFERPESPRFGLRAQFRPIKVAPAGTGGVYLVNEGTTAGLVHFDGDGVFLGYFGAGDVYMSPFDRFIDLILTEEQKRRFLARTPPSFSNIERGPDGLIYSVNRGNNVTVKKHNIGGLNILINDQTPMIQSPVDLTVTARGEVYVLDSSGYITEITREGYLVNLFAGPSAGFDRAGLFNIPSGIASDNAGRIYVLDQDRDYVQVFEPTHSQQQLHQSILAYGQGDYETSKQLLNSVIHRNNSSRLAHTYLGKNYLQDGDYDSAAYHFRVARQINDYSEAYWEIRNRWIQDNLIFLLIGFAALLVFFLWRKSKRKAALRAKAEGTYELTAWDKLKAENRFLFDLSQLPYTLTHPKDQAYEIRVGRTGTWASGLAIILLFFVILVTLNVGSGFIYSVDFKYFNFGAFAAFFIVSLVLFLVSNFLIVAIKDGKGTLRDIFLTLAYSLSPAIILWPFAIALGNVGTLNDAFFYYLLITVGIVWAAVSLFAGLSEIHEYSLRETIMNVLLTFFVMVVIVVILSLLYLIFRQFISLVYEMYLEVVLRG